MEKTIIREDVYYPHLLSTAGHISKSSVQSMVLPYLTYNKIESCPQRDSAVKRVEVL